MRNLALRGSYQRVLRIVVVMALVLTGASARGAAAPGSVKGYQVVVLAGQHGQQGIANASNGEQIVGSVVKSGHSAACVWRSGRIHFLPPVPGFPDSDAVAINDKGMIALNGIKGTRSWTTLTRRACLWSGGRLHVLAVPVGYPHTEALFMDDTGAVYGRALGEGVEIHCCWDASGVHVIPLSIIYGANRRGTLVGKVGEGRKSRPGLWFKGNLKMLPQREGSGRWTATAIDDRGDVLEDFGAGSGVLRASGKFQELTTGGLSAPRVDRMGSPGVDDRCVPLYMSDSGTIAGAIRRGDDFHPAVWPFGGKMILLDDGNLKPAGSVLWLLKGVDRHGVLFGRVQPGGRGAAVAAVLRPVRG